MAIDEAKITKQTNPEAGTGVSAERKRLSIVQAAFVAICAVAVVLPFAGMLWAPTMSTTENRILAEIPSFEENGSFNVDYMSELGSYFEEHFAYRNELVTANSKLRSTLGMSPTDSVVLGDDGWLFYGGTKSDYLGKGTLTDREIENLAFDFSLVQGYCEANGADFALAIVPNKNSIYPEKMPFYFGESAEGNVLNELSSKLDEAQVGNVDLYSLLSETKEAAPDEALYYKLDTHWNQLGALLASERLMEVLGREDAAEELSGYSKSESSENHLGDLSEMLLPSEPQSEVAVSYEDATGYRVTEGANEIDTEASAWIEAEGQGDGVLYMFRDSFAQNMVPFLSSAYSKSYYDWYVPFDYTKIQGRDVTDVVVEKAERNLPDLVKNPGIMPAPTFQLADQEVSLIQDGSSFGAQEPTTREDGPFVVIEGVLPEALDFERVDDVYVLAENAGGATCHVPFRVTIDGDSRSYRAYIYANELSAATGIGVAVQQGDNIVRLCEVEINL